MSIEITIEKQQLRIVIIIIKIIRTKVVIISKTFLSLHSQIKNQHGGLAHLARARHWQCRGDRFESDNLHKNTLITI